ncbi:MAG: L-serine ammonia-lyase, iron-sulfur-dependent, subunit alpha [Pseudomonadota bacterium]
MTYSVKEILKIQVAPALGCTEPVAIALAAAAAAAVLPNRDVDAVEVWVDPNIYKNGLAVSIPGTSGMTGLAAAAALGALGGDPTLKMEVLSPIGLVEEGRARDFLRAERVKINLLTEHRGLFIKARVTAGADVAEAVIKDLHDNIVSLSLNGAPMEGSITPGADSETPKPDVLDMENWLKKQPLSDLLKFIDELDADDFKFLEEGIRVNVRLAEHGLKYGPGLGVGRTLERLVRQRLIKKDMILAARMLTSAAADARMAGVKLPAMSSAGSGNHGLTAVLPIWAVREFVECDMKTVLEAAALSHILTAYVKAFTGRLSAVCGCSIAAGAGATAGVTYLLGGDARHIAGAVTNLTEDLAGIICDGAKNGCAFKLATAAGAAVQAALFALQGVYVQPTDGIIGASFEQTAQNIGDLSTQGMIETDRTILRIMLEKKFSGF